MAAPNFSDPDLPLSELFAACPQAASVFLDQRMLCPGCPVARFHAIAEACAAYGLDETCFRARLTRRTGMLFDAGQGPLSGSAARRCTSAISRDQRDRPQKDQT
ncbi:DUF1858 domain-containing protein [Paracoccus rhizosphaerae]|uniref:DUF1858 domain-containing protein n=1 Tax=Paracoccus rhizosphaerae TaxID=1133347 RepID=A0ABV6CIP6_9RHOB